MGLNKYYYVYLIVSKKNKKIKSYVGYTNNISKRIMLHNTGKGAKSTRGRNWSVIYKKKFLTKSKAMKFEYLLKKNKKMRKIIKGKYG